MPRESLHLFGRGGATTAVLPRSQQSRPIMGAHSTMTVSAAKRRSAAAVWIFSRCHVLPQDLVSGLKA